MDEKMESGTLEEVEFRERSKVWEELGILLEAKDDIRFQQAKSQWVKDGDTNSQYFHKCVERKGRVKKLLDCVYWANGWKMSQKLKMKPDNTF